MLSNDQSVSLELAALKKSQESERENTSWFLLSDSFSGSLSRETGERGSGRSRERIRERGNNLPSYGECTPDERESAQQCKRGESFCFLCILHWPIRFTYTNDDRKSAKREQIADQRQICFRGSNWISRGINTDWQRQRQRMWNDETHTHTSSPSRWQMDN